MKTSRFFLPLALLAGLSGLPAQAQSADKGKLEQVDRNFVCPETMPDEAARREAVKQYLLNIRDAWPDATADDMIAFRKFLLNKHSCAKTLENLKQQNQ